MENSITLLPYEKACAGSPSQATTILSTRCFRVQVNDWVCSSVPKYLLAEANIAQYFLLLEDLRNFSHFTISLFA